MLDPLLLSFGYPSATVKELPRHPKPESGCLGILNLVLQTPSADSPKELAVNHTPWWELF